MKLAFAATTALLLTACSSGLKVVESDLQHHHWNLTAIDGVAVNAELKSELEIGEHFSINGRAGCNRFFGSATLTQGVLKAETLGTTRMACAPEAQQVESAVLDTLNNGAVIKQDGQLLELKGDTHTLTYQLADWVQ
ncbi:META domain-containing protein [Oceanimonas baumannii]|uniref:Heat shock protein HslJ n=1 Tax=Oceanimonas baumannii TaxID=129578 RepID=A0A235CF77_9GAMM|nr:META domain-containing protein [Oceanimonas baumannii]OYD23281.1 heat-shock protein HslJ [Oceanimonas baumannii]TDW58575.1 heat shock protein HslJ [Oceanimonas baumannii]